MADDTFQAVLGSAGVTIAPASPEFLAWLGTKKAPREVVEILAAGLPGKQKRRYRLWGDRWDFSTEEEILKEAAEFPRYLKAGLLSIGSCVNGDPIVLDLRKQAGTVGFLSHDEIWEDEDVRVRACYVTVAPSLAEFARRARDGLAPIDYYEARDGK